MSLSSSDERPSVLAYYKAGEYRRACLLFGRLEIIQKHRRIRRRTIRTTTAHKENYRVSIVSNSNLISFQTSQAAASSGDHLQAARITSPPSRAKSRPSLRA